MVGFESFKDLWQWLWYDAVLREVVLLAGYMVVGGLLGFYVRAIYRRFAATVSGRESFGAIFPLLIVSTVLVIFVVKSSLALSLGLVGALSIVRFRAAIKEPEELVYLFFCIAAGLALGAEYLPLALVATVVFTGFVVAENSMRSARRRHSLLLTISGELDEGYAASPGRITEMLGEVVDQFTIQRLDVEAGHIQLRAVVEPESEQAVGAMLAALAEKVPQCRVSYSNLEGLL